jgi:predicted ATPase
MLLDKIELENILSFKQTDLELQPLNVFIGPNASGKSNVIRALGLARSLPKDLSAEIASGGGPRGWINRRTNGPARIRLIGRASPLFDYSLSFREAGQGYEILAEDYPGTFERRNDWFILGTSFDINGTPPAQTAHLPTDYVYQAYPRILYHPTKAPTGREFKQPVDVPREPGWVDNPGKFLGQGTLSVTNSVLAEVRHPGEPKIRELGTALENIRLYREFTTGPNTSTRRGISSSAVGAFLFEDGGNLALVLNEMEHHRLLDRVNRYLEKLSDLLEEVTVLTRGGVTQVYVREKGVREPFAATALSDGTLKLLCLLALLVDPEPPPLVCIEEPETGLHPDAVRTVAELLVDASQRMQLVVTTHSPALVDALTSQPESVLVCERDFDGFTQFRRLKSKELDEWLEEYSLGQLWQKGEIGGNRW